MKLEIMHSRSVWNAWWTESGRYINLKKATRIKSLFFYMKSISEPYETIIIEIWVISIGIYYIFDFQFSMCHLCMYNALCSRLFEFNYVTLKCIWLLKKINICGLCCCCAVYAVILRIMLVIRVMYGALWISKHQCLIYHSAHTRDRMLLICHQCAQAIYGWCYWMCENFGFRVWPPTRPLPQKCVCDSTPVTTP